MVLCFIFKGWRHVDTFYAITAGDFQIIQSSVPEEPEPQRADIPYQNESPEFRFAGTNLLSHTSP